MIMNNKLDHLETNFLYDQLAKENLINSFMFSTAEKKANSESFLIYPNLSSCISKYYKYLIQLLIQYRLYYSDPNNSLEFVDNEYQATLTLSIYAKSVKTSINNVIEFLDLLEYLELIKVSYYKNVNKNYAKVIIKDWIPVRLERANNKLI